MKGKEESFSFLPSTSPFIPLLCSLPDFLDELAGKRLLAGY